MLKDCPPAGNFTVSRLQLSAGITFKAERGAGITQKLLWVMFPHPKEKTER
ncbi:MAG: hypothetical protein KME19_12825 [Microcoleus vaginatus WJT46-NPBG5]|nr:hypothetical protein [Microcoleus vaginatus WJT46-NPBG5]